MKRLQVGDTVSAQFRTMEDGDEMEILFFEKLPHIVKTLVNRLVHKGYKLECEVIKSEGRTIVRNISSK